MFIHYVTNSSNVETVVRIASSSAATFCPKTGRNVTKSSHLTQAFIKLVFKWLFTKYSCIFVSMCLLPLWLHTRTNFLNKGGCLCPPVGGYHKLDTAMSYTTGVSRQCSFTFTKGSTWCFASGSSYIISKLTNSLHHLLLCFRTVTVHKKIHRHVRKSSLI